MNKQALSLAVFVAGAYPTVSNALSLGDIQSNSNLNQPLQAKIELLSTNVQEAQQLKVRLAPPSVFNRVGIDRPSYLNSLRFSPTIQNGKPVIMVSSATPIKEPFVNFLVEVTWPQGQLLKEYTVMLDPPVLMQAGSTMANEAAVRAEPQATGQVARQQLRQQPAQNTQQQAQAARQQQIQAQRQAQQRQAQAQRDAQRRAEQQLRQRQAQQAQAQQRRPAASKTYRVRSGDTLYKVAARMKPAGVSTDQMMMALYRANPSAFIRNNINGLKRGSVLRSPSLNQLRQTGSPNQARRQVRQQYQDWKNFRSKVASNTQPQRRANNNATSAQRAANNQTPRNDPKAKLEVLGSNGQKAGANLAAAAAGKARLQELEKQLMLARESLTARQRENDELKSRVTELESIVDTKNRLITLRDRDLAKLQNQIALTNKKKPETTAVTQEPEAASTPEVQKADTPASNLGDTAGKVAAGIGAAGAAAAGAMALNNRFNNDEPEKPAVVEPTQADAANDLRNQVAGNMNGDTINRHQEAVPEKPINNRFVTPPPPEPLDEPEEKLQPIETEKAATSPFTDEQNEGEDLLSMLTSPKALMIAGGALGSLLLLGLLSRFLGRRKKKVANEPVAADDFSTTYDDKPAGSEVFANLEDDIKRAESKDNDLIHDNAWGEDSGISQETTTTSPETAEDLQEEDDVLMESDVYIAYGLHQQAETELTKAIERHPERLEYRHKLLQNHFAANNRESFDEAASDFLKAEGNNKDALWKDIVTWGRKISPDNPIYTDDLSARLGSAQADNHPVEDDSMGLGTKLAAGAAAVAAAGAATVAATRDAAADTADAVGDAVSNTADAAGNMVGNAVDATGDALSATGDTIGQGVDSVTDSANDLTNDLDMPDLDLGLPDEDLSLDLDMPDLDLGSDFDETLDDIDQNTNLGNVDLDTSLDADNSLNQTSTGLDDLDLDLDFDLDLPTDTQDTNTDPLDLSDLDLGQELDDVTQADDALTSDLDALLAEVDQEESLLDKAGDALGSAKDAVVDTAIDAKDAVVDTATNVKEAVTGTADQAVDAGQQAVTDLDNALTPDDGLDFDLTGLLDDEPAADSGLGTTAKVAAGAAAAGAVAAVANTAANAKADVTNLDLHVRGNEINKVLPEENLYASKEEAVPAEDEWLGDIDDALSFLDLPDEEIDLHEAHISTKLDLARAYLDMGDIEGARSTLEEVMVEGNDDQRREAETLLHQTG